MPPRKSGNRWRANLPAKCVVVSALIACALASAPRADAAAWTKLTNTAPTNTGIMLQLTDGTVMVVLSDNQTWAKLTPDNNGSYINGTWSLTAPMSTPRLYFASNVLPDGRVWVLGGEYSGPGLLSNWINTGEIYDPVANTWTPIAPYPNQSGCPQLSSLTGNLVNGSPMITNIYPTTSVLQVGWGVSGIGIPAGATIVSINSATQITISAAATVTRTAGMFSLDRPFRLPGCFGDDPSMLVTGGTKGRILAGDLLNGNSYLYDIATNTWTFAAAKAYSDSSDEETWVKLPDGSVITYDLFQSIATGGAYAEKYNPLTNTWSGISPTDGTAKGTIPPLSSSTLGYEFGGALRLQDGRVFVIGATQHTAFYDPSTNTWSAGPDTIGNLNGFPSPFGSDDAPAAILPNGHVIYTADAGPSRLVTTGNITAGSNTITNIPSTATLRVGWSVSGTGIPPGTSITSIDSLTQVHISRAATATINNDPLAFGGTFSTPTQIFDFNPVTDTTSPISPAYPVDLSTRPAFVTRMLMLPTGQLLFSDASNQLYIFTGDGVPSPALRPVINHVTYGGGGVFTLTGKQLNGQSAGASYGDDAEMDSNYPIVRLTNSLGQVFYARTTNWSTSGVATGTALETVNFTLNPALVTPGNYSVVVSGAGIASFPAVVNITLAEINKL